MKHNVPIFVRVIVALTVLGTIVGYFYFQYLQNSTKGLTASGNVEAVEVKISPEINGKVADVTKNLGDPVAVGDPLFSLDGLVLLAQQKVAQANLDGASAAVETASKALDMAQAQFDAAMDGSSAEERAQRASRWNSTPESGIDQPAWYYSLEEEFLSLNAANEAAKVDLTSAQDELKSVEEKSASKDFLQIEKELGDAQIAYEVALDVRDQVGDANDNAKLNDEADKLVTDAETDLEDAQQAYDDAMISEGATDILEARAAVQVAQTRLDVIAAKLLTYKTGDRSTKIELARITLEQAQASHKQAEQAKATAQANLDLVSAQVSKLTVSSPTNGIVQMRNLEVGEVVNPGMVVFTILDLSQLSVTVYISEDHYGEISLGQAVEITADSFPGKVFSGQVIQISDKAEFTPRNVQTTDGRKTTVFAIKIQVDDTEGLLKPGMPADVAFK